MSTLSPKQQAIRERERRILELTRESVVNGGYHGLSLDQIAAELGVSRGTIYNHFRCKEEIILAVLLETVERRRAMFSSAAAWRGLPRERMAAVGVAAELFVRLAPDHFRFEQIMELDSVRDKTSEQRRGLFQSCQLQCVSILAGIVRDAVAQGHLQLPENHTPEDLIFGLWSMSEGAYSILATRESMTDLGIQEPFKAVRTNIHQMLDGFGWAPLASEHDYDAVARRALDELFPDESRKLKLKGGW